MAHELITLDTETTGLKWEEGHRVIEIGCVHLLSDGSLGKRWQCYLNPERSIPDESYRIHGLSEDDLRDKPFFADIADDFLSFIGDARLVMHNAPFDVGFLNHELKMIGKEALQWERVVDSLKKARARYPGERATLDALCRRFNISIQHRSVHGALKDAELLARVYAEMEGYGSVSLGLKFEKEKVLQSSSRVSSVESVEKSLKGSLPSHDLSDSQLQEHEKMMERMSQLSKGEILWKS